ncbi:MAG: hypothetical protein KDC18_09070 [Alphaproteobacteria bacterium]|nr:hypothetical protein [Alphaproteobacteria bacterium]MCB9930962.1 hypothetical protein [Alphaproteobacteria bacterium]
MSRHGSRYEDRYYGSRYSRHDSDHDDHGSRYGSRHSDHDDHGSRYGSRHSDHDDHGSRYGSHDDQDLYSFTFAPDINGNLDVTQMFEIERGRAEWQSIRRSEFTVEQDLVGNVVNVTETEFKWNEVEVKSYSDLDGDGLFTQDFEIEVATSARGAEQHEFIFDLNGNITADLELTWRGARNDWIRSNESYQEIDVFGISHVVKTTTDWNEVEFEVFRDDNGDGIYTQIAEGETQSDAFLDLSGNVDFAAIQAHLAPADTIIG